jgi:hypothetical protein
MALLLVGLSVLAPSFLEGQPVPRSRAQAPSSISTGWHVSGLWIQSMDTGPFGTRWGQDIRGFGANLEGPAIRGIRPSVEGARVEIREQCGLSADCPFVDGWIVRVGGILGDITANTESRVTPYVRGDVGLAITNEETRFSPAFRIGLLVRTIPRVTPQISYGWARYPEGRDGAEVTAGLRLTVR